MKVVLVGLGMVAETHVNAIQAIGPSVQLVGVLSRCKDKAQQFVNEKVATQASEVKVYDHADAVAEDDSVDAVVICTPPNARVDLIEKFASAGKHILIEKPIERSFDAAKSVVEICENHGVKLGVFLQHRMRESALKMKQILQSDVLGDIAVIEIIVPWWREQAYYDEPGRGTYARDGGGVLISQSIHTLDLALSLFGSIQQVQAMARTTGLHQMESEDYVTAGLDFCSGAVGSLVASTASFPGGVESIVVHGTQGSANLTSGKLEVVFRNGKSDVYGQDMATGGGADPMAFTHAWHQAIYEDFFEAVKIDSQPAVSGREALQVHALIEALIKSSKKGRAVCVTSVEQP